MRLLFLLDLDKNHLEKAKSLVPRVCTVQVERGVKSAGLIKKIVKALGEMARDVVRNAS
jgi:hypothetical protein